MYMYSVTQWIAFLILYSFLGWIWECCYVSVRQKKWVNRGFLHGPLLPIYGSGAVIVLFAALPFKGNVIAVYIAGMISATILEYCTGAAMEALFKVRYWDYSNNKFNLNGHICLFCSLGWGFFSIAMVYVLHHPFERAVLAIPEKILTPAMYVIIMLASADYALSFKAAIELRDILVKLEEAKHEAQLMQKRIEVYEAFLADDLIQHREKLEAMLQEKKLSLSERRENEIRELLELLHSLHEKKESLSEKRAETREKLFHQIHEQKTELHQNLTDLQTKIEQHKINSKDIRSLLERNPGAVSKKYMQVLEEIKKQR